MYIRALLQDNKNKRRTTSSFVTSGMSEVWRNLPPQATAKRDPVWAQSEGWRHCGAEGPAERGPFWDASQPGPIPGGPGGAADTISRARGLRERAPEAQERSRAAPWKTGSRGRGVVPPSWRSVQSQRPRCVGKWDSEGTVHESFYPSGASCGRERWSQSLRVPWWRGAPSGLGRREWRSKGTEAECRDCVRTQTTGMCIFLHCFQTKFVI